MNSIDALLQLHDAEPDADLTPAETAHAEDLLAQIIQHAGLRAGRDRRYRPGAHDVLGREDHRHRAERHLGALVAAEGRLHRGPQRRHGDWTTAGGARHTAPAETLCAN
jgi:hypothetical protein